MKKSGDHATRGVSLFEAYANTIQKCAAIQANRLLRSGFFLESERRDLAQEISLGVWGRCKYYDEGRGKPRAYIGYLAKQEAHSIFIKRKAERRPEQLEEECAALGRCYRYTPKLRDAIEKAMPLLSVPSQILLISLQMQHRNQLAFICDIDRQSWRSAVETLKAELGYLEVDLGGFCGKTPLPKPKAPDLANYSRKQYIGMMRLVASPHFEAFERMPQQQYLIETLQTSYRQVFKRPFPVRQVFDSFRLSTRGRSIRLIQQNYCKRLLKQVAVIYDKAQEASESTILKRDDLLIPDVRYTETDEQLKHYLKFLSAVRLRFSDSAANAPLLGVEALNRELEILKPVSDTFSLLCQFIYFGTIVWHRRDKIDNESRLLLVHNRLRMHEMSIPLASATWPVAEKKRSIGEQ